MGAVIPFAMMAGVGMQGLSAYRQGQYAAQQAKAQAAISQYNSEVSLANAEAIKQKSMFDQIRALHRGRRIEGKLRAKMGASGAVISEGAPADVLAQQGYENALDVALIGYEGIIGAQQQRSAAGMYAAEAANYRTTASNVRQAGRYGALERLLTGFGTMSAEGMFPSQLDFLNYKA